jgi:hypothetical protein
LGLLIARHSTTNPPFAVKWWILFNDLQIVERFHNAFAVFGKIMKRLFWLIGLMALMACGGGEDVVPAETPATQSTIPAPATLPSGYPASTATPLGAYPALPRATPTLTAAYIGVDPVWVIKPVGMQCQAVEIALDVERVGLENAGIRVLDTTMIAIATCEACDTCPSSEHYRFYIPTTDIAKAEALGWTVAE